MIDDGSPRLLSSHELSFNLVKDAVGTELGRVETLMIDLLTGRVAYAVVRLRCRHGLGERRFAVPWSTLALDHDAAAFVLSVDEERLERAPGIDAAVLLGPGPREEQILSLPARPPTWRGIEHAGT